MDKSNKELAIILMAGEIAGTMATDKDPPTTKDLNLLRQARFCLQKGAVHDILRRQAKS